MICFVAGASESGKTIAVRKMTAIANQPRIVIDPGRSWGDEGIAVQDPWPPVARLLRGGYTGSLVLDDADTYLGPAGGTDWRPLWTMHRHFGLDLFAIVRRVQDLPRVAWASCSRLLVFRTIPGSPAAKYLHTNYIPADIPLPTVPFEYLDCDLFAEKYVRRKLSVEDLEKYGNPRGQ